MGSFEIDGKYSSKSPGVKRLMREACELKESTEEYDAHPLEDNLFEWHFTIKGPPDSEFDGGIYHGRIILPNEYPMKPPNIILLTPNGRFEINTKICLSISGHHPETWQPSWSIRTALLALIAFMRTPGNGTAGSLDYAPEERRVLARKSKQWSCAVCGKPALKDCQADSSDKVSAAESKEDVTDNASSVTSNATQKTSTIAEDMRPTTYSENSSSGIATNVCIGVLIVAILAIILRRLFLM